MNPTKPMNPDRQPWAAALVAIPWPLSIAEAWASSSWTTCGATGPRGWLGRHLGAANVAFDDQTGEPRFPDRMVDEFHARCSNALTRSAARAFMRMKPGSVPSERRTAAHASETRNEAMDRLPHHLAPSSPVR